MLTKEEFEEEIYHKLCTEGLEYWAQNYAPWSLLSKKDKDFYEALGELDYALENVRFFLSDYCKKFDLEEEF